MKTTDQHSIDNLLLREGGYPHLPESNSATNNSKKPSEKLKHHPICDGHYPSLCDACNAEAKEEVQTKQDHIGDINEKAQLQAPKNESQWISVDERLPELSDKELIVRLKPRRKNQKKVEYRIAIYDKPCEWEDPVFWCVVREVDIEVDSWMSLPPTIEGQKHA